MRILIEYWAQIAIVIAAIGYGLKVLLDHSFKRKEIGYTVFTKGKLEAITGVLETYEAAQAEAFVLLYTYFEKENNRTDFALNCKNLILLSDKLTKQREHLRFFLTEDEYTLFLNLTSNFHLVEGSMNLYSESMRTEGLVHKEWYEEQEQLLIKNEEIVKEIITVMQRKFM